MAAITWTNQTNVTVVGTTISKSGGSSGSPDAYATSTESSSTDGDLSFTAAAAINLVMGLGSSASPMSSGSIEHSFWFSPTGTCEVRESGAYRTETAYVASDVFTIRRTSNVITFLRNGFLLHTSTLAASGNRYAQLVIGNIGDSISAATMTGSTPTISVLPDASATTQTTAPQTYSEAITDRLQRIRPTSASSVARNATYVQTAFNNRVIKRLTDGTVGAQLNRSHRMPSSEVCCAWGRDSSEIYSTNTHGQIEVWSLNQSLLELTLARTPSFNNEPTFSRVRAHKLIGAVGFKVREYDTQADTYTTLVDIAVVDPTYTGGSLVMGGTVQTSASNPERLACFYGGTSQDLHYRVLVCDVNTPSNQLILDTQAKTINGSAVAMESILIHAIAFDQGGRYVLIYSTTADIIAGKAPKYIWDITTGSVLPMTNAMYPYGHDAPGYRVLVNQDAGAGPYDALQWQFRSLGDLSHPSPVLGSVITPTMTYMSDHPSWNNARSDVMTPFVTATTRYNENVSENIEPDNGSNHSNTVPYRAGDNEVLCVHPLTGVISRWCHHYSIIYSDNGANVNGAFWYAPIPQISPNGRFIVWHENFFKTLGLDAGEPNPGPEIYREDLFLVDTQSAGVEPPPVTSPTRAYITRYGKGLW